MNIADSSIVTIYSDIMAFVLVMGLLYMYHRYRIGRDEHADELFDKLSVITMINAVVNGLCYMLHGQPTDLPAVLRRILPSMAELSVLVIVYIWILYVYYRIYGSWDRVIRLRKGYALPVLFFTAATLINLTTGILFDVDERWIFVAKPLFGFMTATVYVYGFLPVFLVLWYEKHHGKLHFFHISAIIVPGLVAALLTLLTEYSARALGFAVALVFMHISYNSRWRFEDSQSGFFNRQYLAHILDLVRTGEKNYKIALVFETGKEEKAAYEILRAELPKDSEVIRIDREKLLLFSESRDSSMVALLSSLINEAVEEYEKEHPDGGAVDMKVSGKLRKRNESAVEFVQRATGR